MIHSTRPENAVVRLLATIVLGLALALPSHVASAQEITVSALCGWGYAGAFNTPDDTAYTLKNAGPLCVTYLACTYYWQSTEYHCNGGWSTGPQVDSIQYSATVSGVHRLCNETLTICSLWGYTSDS